MFAYLRAQLRHHINLRFVSALERRIADAITLYRYDLQTRLTQLRLSVIYDYQLEPGVTLVFEPRSRMIRLASAISATDRRLALAMLLAHLSVTHAQQPMTQLPTYLIYTSDLHSEDGPSCNHQWHEFHHALDLIFPVEAYQAILTLFPAKQRHYALQRILVVSPELITLRVNQFMHGVVAYPTLPDLSTLLQPKEC